jgi:hypothetical protein
MTTFFLLLFRTVADSLPVSEDDGDFVSSDEQLQPSALAALRMGNNLHEAGVAPSVQQEEDQQQQKAPGYFSNRPRYKLTRMFSLKVLSEVYFGQKNLVKSIITKFIRSYSRTLYK